MDAPLVISSSILVPLGALVIGGKSSTFGVLAAMVVGLDALWLDDQNIEIKPSSRSEWADWIAATRTRNYVLGDPLLDWLSMFGANHGFVPDSEYSGYDIKTDFTEFIFAQGRGFETAVMQQIESLVPVTKISNNSYDVRDLNTSIKTVEAMRAGAEIIYQGALRNPETRTYGTPDLLVRSDVLAQLFPGQAGAIATHDGAPGIDVRSKHYCVVDIKFTTLHLTGAGILMNIGSAPAYKVQVSLYNSALGRIQGLTPSNGFVIGRGWQIRKGRQTSRGVSCMEKLGIISMDSTIGGNVQVGDAANDAVDWVRKVRHEGNGWSLYPVPSVPELYPNMSNVQDSPWHRAKGDIAEELQELSLIWNVGVAVRRHLHSQGIKKWRDPKFSAEAVGMNPGDQYETLNRILQVNREQETSLVLPRIIHTAREEWGTERPLEFYVDFESVSDLNDDFSKMPQRAGTPMIFMIGCGHVEDGEWVFRQFTVDILTPPEERRILDEWFAYMAAVRESEGPDGSLPLIFHWSPAERLSLVAEYNSVAFRHPDIDWPALAWFDFYTEVMIAEPVVVKGAMDFGLKSIAKAFKSHGFVDTLWKEGPADGLGAMIGAFWCDQTARDNGVPMRDSALMHQISGYNEVDCLVMMEAIRYLRHHH